MIIRLLIFVMTIYSFELSAATTGTLNLRGSITQNISIVVVQNAAAQSLNLDIAETDIIVGSVNQISNSNTGYKISLSSANNGKLKFNSYLASYTLKLGNNVVALSSAPVVVKTVSGAGVYNVTEDLKVSHAVQVNVAGYYTDTLTFTIAAN